MAKPPELFQINPEDFEEDDRAVGATIAGLLNNFLLQVIQLLNQSLTFQDNFASEVKKIVIVGGGSITFKLTNVKTPVGVVLLDYKNASADDEILSIPVGNPQWKFDGKGNLTIHPIPGLTVDNNYRVTLLVTAG